MRILVDTNILVRLSEPGHVRHSIAQDAVGELRRVGHQLFIVPQLLYEFWSVATRPIQNNGLAMVVNEARQSLDDAKEAFRLLRDERAVYERWERLVVDYDVGGKSAHDARLVAAMQRHGVSHLLTFNGQDFARFTNITVVDPANAAKLPAVD